MKKETIVLEPSTNSHSMTGNVTVKTELPEMGGLVLEVEGKGIVLHGEHGVVVTDSKNIIKLVQQEVSPITGLLQNAFD